MSPKVARLPQDVIEIIMFYKHLFEKNEAFWRFFDEIWCFLQVPEKKV